MTPTLHGHRVVSTAINVPGPVAVNLLRGMGATVVKIEPPTGDPLASAAPGWYAALCDGIDVIRLDLKSPDNRGAVDNLLAQADLLVTASRPASLQRLGLTWPELHARYPRLCHVGIVGYSSPRENVAGHDLTYQADAGLLTPPAMPRALIADLSGAQRAVIAALELLFARERRQEAGYAEIALAACASFFAEPLRHGLTDPAGPLGGADAAYGVYRSSDGWVAVAALEPQFRAALARELDVDLDDRRALARLLQERTALEWERWAEPRGLPIAALR